MTFDEQDQADRHSPPHDEEAEGKHSKRGRLKDALNRTKTKLHNVREEREARKHSKDSQQPEFTLDDNVNDFLAAGRPSIGSSRPSYGSVIVPPSDDSSAIYESSTGSPRPSTSDSKLQTSPRRGPPTVPRIDVSASSRFPNARMVHPDDRLLSSSETQDQTPSGSLLAPEYKTRSLSTSSILSKERKQRIRGLSVGFADAPPVIIGEGGEEAQAPPVEISRAKARARSASPQPRKPFPVHATQQAPARDPMPARAISDNAAGFVPKPLTRIQTGAVGSFQRDPRGPHDDDLFPSSSSRLPGGLADYQSPVMEKKPPLPARNIDLFKPIGRVDTGSLNLTKEFEMTLGLHSPSQTSPTAGKDLSAEPVPIAAPKPMRAPPNYDVLENGDSISVADQKAQPYHEPPNISQDAAQISHAPHRRPVPARQGQEADRSQQSSAPQQSNLYYPPPPQRQTTQVKRNIQKLEPIQPRSKQAMPEPGATPKMPLQLVTEVDDGYRSFSERQKDGSMGSMPSRQSLGTPTTYESPRYIASHEYERSPSNYAGSKETTPHTATDPTPTTMRFYENLRKQTPPKGML